MGRLLKKIPKRYFKSVFKIDFLALKQQGIKLLLIDIDNTLVSYDDPIPTKEVEKLFEELEKLDFEVILISNNNFKRVSTFAKHSKLKFVEKAFKPLKRGYKKALNLANNKYRNEQVCVIGDQLFTDILGGNKMNFYTILVDPVKVNTEVWTTKINRYRENKLIKKLRQKYPKIYHEVLSNYEM